MTDLTEEEIQAQLAGESVRGPRSFKGQPLATLTAGLRDLRNKVSDRADPTGFLDLLLIKILVDASATTEEEEFLKRRALIIATDDVAGFRARASIWNDKLTDDDRAEVRRLADEILGLVEKAEVSIAEKKSVSPAAAEPSPTVMPPTSGSSCEPPTAGPQTSSDGGSPS
jgi:hypothetical protein